MPVMCCPFAMQIRRNKQGSDSHWRRGKRKRMDGTMGEGEQEQDKMRQLDVDSMALALA